MMLLNGSKFGNGDEHQPKLSNLFKNFNYNGGGRWWLKGGDGGEVLQAFSLKITLLKVPNEWDDTAITKAGTKLLLHRAHFPCSRDTLGISILKVSAAAT
ncbi:hypothetical protein Tco_1497256 [Tanacetum coccineum]